VSGSGSIAARLFVSVMITATIWGCDSVTAPSQPARPSVAPEPGQSGIHPDLGTAGPTEAAQPTFGATPIGPTEAATVVRVVDGDTIVIDRGGGAERLRYIGIDAPESGDSASPGGWMGAEASAANRRLVEGQSVILERDVSEVDRFGRLLRYVWIGTITATASWRFVNLELVSGGYAQVSTFPPDVRYVDLYRAAQDRARSGSLGLWGAPSGATSAPLFTIRPPTLVGLCEPSYPTVCIPSSPPDLDCGDVVFRRFVVRAPDPHRFDGDANGIGCESP